MGVTQRLELLYLLNATVLISHEIDSAYWQEWQLLHLPGGIQLFLVFHLLLIPAVLWGYREICRRGSRIKAVSLGLAAVGFFAALLHGAFIFSGDSAFTLPMSTALLLATFVISSFQFYTALCFNN